MKSRFAFPCKLSESSELSNKDDVLKSKKMSLLPQSENQTCIKTWIFSSCWWVTSFENWKDQHVGCLEWSSFTKGNLWQAPQPWDLKDVFYKCRLHEATGLFLGEQLCGRLTASTGSMLLCHRRENVGSRSQETWRAHNNNPWSSDIFENNFIDKYNPQQSKELEKLCLYDFVQWEEPCENQIAVQSGQWLLRTMS